MDPTQTLNALRQYMDFYARNLMTPNNGQRSVWDVSGSPRGDPGAALGFAESLMGGQNQGMNGGQDGSYGGAMPYLNAQSQGYVQPQQFGSVQPQQAQRAPLMDDQTNYLRTLIQSNGAKRGY